MPRTTSMQKRWASEPVQIETPPDARLLAGWIGGAQGELPEAKWENWWHNRVDEALHEIESTGAPKWFADVPYQPLALARVGETNWICRIANTGVSPTSSANQGHWVAQVDASRLLPKRGYAPNDFIRIPNEPGGLIVQFGRIAYPDIAVTAVIPFTFPIAFPAACYVVVPAVDTGQAPVVVNPRNVSTTGGVFEAVEFDTRAAPGTINYIAIGY